MLNLAWQGDRSDIVNLLLEEIQTSGGVPVVPVGNTVMDNATIRTTDPDVIYAQYMNSTCVTASPTSAPGVIVAGAVDRYGQASWSSQNYGCVTTYAPGVKVFGDSGTSLATAITSGAASLLLANRPCLSSADMAYLLHPDDLRCNQEALNLTSMFELLGNRTCTPVTAFEDVSVTPQNVADAIDLWTNGSFYTQCIADYTTFSQPGSSCNQCCSNRCTFVSLATRTSRGYSVTCLAGSPPPPPAIPVCPAGQAINVYLSLTCFTCYAGMYCPGDQNTYPCVAGTYSGAGASICTACPMGTYSDTAGATQCTTCPVGTFGTIDTNAGYANSASYCSRCTPGTYGPDGYNCYQCPAGTFQQYYQQSACTLCPIDTYCPGTGNQLPTACAFAGYVVTYTYSYYLSQNVGPMLCFSRTSFDTSAKSCATCA